MNSRQRIEAAFGHREPDRTPIMEYVLFSPVADAILGRKFISAASGGSEWRDLAREVGFEEAVRRYARDRVDLARLLGHDLMYVSPTPAQSSLYPKPQKERPPMPQEDDPAERVAWCNECRALELSEPEDDSPYLVYAFLKEEMTRQEMDIPLWMPAYAHGVWTDVDLMETMLIEPDVAHRHFELATQWCMSTTRKLVQAGAEYVGVGGDFSGNRPLISPAAYREFIVPEMKKCTDLVHELGCKAINASDGDLWSVIEDYLFGTGVDAYAEIDYSVGMDLGKLKRLYGDWITLIGNMDCGNVLSFASEEEIRRLSIECIEAGLGNGGHIFTASNAISASVPVKNYLAMVNAYREYFNLPRFVL